jgi:microsomal dipeptidase-like Zn-dependent dipeptidase
MLLVVVCLVVLRTKVRRELGDDRLEELLDTVGVIGVAVPDGDVG